MVGILTEVFTMKIDYREMKIDLIRMMTQALENACAYHATGEKELFHYSAGKAESVRIILEDYFEYDSSCYSEHIVNMFEIIDEEW